MRDSFGGVFTINLLLVFIFIYVAFTAISLTYAKEFKIKNRVIDFLEQNEIISLDEAYLSSKVSQLDNIIASANYNVTCEAINAEDGEETDNTGAVVGYCYNGIKIDIIEENQIEGTTTSKIKYQITTGATWTLGALNKILVLAGEQENSRGTVLGTWKITGEAVVIKNN